MCANISCSENWKTHAHTRTTHSRRHLRTHMRTHTFDDESSEIGNTHDAQTHTHPHTHTHTHTHTYTGVKGRVEIWEGVRCWTFTKLKKTYINLFVNEVVKTFFYIQVKKISLRQGWKKCPLLANQKSCVYNVTHSIRNIKRMLSKILQFRRTQLKIDSTFCRCRVFHETLKRGHTACRRPSSRSGKLMKRKSRRPRRKCVLLFWQTSLWMYLYMQLYLCIQLQMYSCIFFEKVKSSGLKSVESVWRENVGKYLL